MWGIWWWIDMNTSSVSALIVSYHLCDPLSLIVPSSVEDGPSGVCTLILDIVDNGMVNEKGKIVLLSLYVFIVTSLMRRKSSNSLLRQFTLHFLTTIATTSVSFFFIRESFWFMLSFQFIEFYPTLHASFTKFASVPDNSSQDRESLLYCSQSVPLFVQLNGV